MTKPIPIFAMGLGVAVLLSTVKLLAADEQPLERRVVIRTVRTLEQTLAAVEATAAKQRPKALKRLRNSTLLAQSYVADKLTRSGQPEVVYPTAMVSFIVKQVDQGVEAQPLAKAVLSTMQEDGFASEDADMHKGESK